MPAGTPSSVTPTSGPCDSPKIETLNSLPKLFIWLSFRCGRVRPDGAARSDRPRIRVRLGDGFRSADRDASLPASQGATAAAIAIRWSLWLLTSAPRISPPVTRITSGVDRSTLMPMLSSTSAIVRARSLSLCASRRVPLSVEGALAEAASAAARGRGRGSAWHRIRKRATGCGGP